MSPHDLLHHLMGKSDPARRWALREQNPHGIKITSQIELLKDGDTARAQRAGALLHLGHHTEAKRYLEEAASLVLPDTAIIKHTSQDCPACGYREKKPLWVRAFTCPACGAALHRDVAAALNILAKARTEPAGMGTAWAVP